jgi:hypothetical protein
MKRKNKFAQALGRMAKGVSKKLSPEEREARRMSGDARRVQSIREAFDQLNKDWSASGTSVDEDCLKFIREVERILSS